MSDNFYRAFEDRYRGSRELIKTRLQAYQPFLESILAVEPETPQAIDFGCGRGEWLEYISGLGFDAKGVDLDEGMLAACSDMGLVAEKGELLDYIAAVDSQSSMVISAFHVVEHISFDDLRAFVTEAMRALKPGGLLIMETPNPENIVVATRNFYLDPTHQKPIPSELLAFVAEFAGFERVKTLRLQESKELALKEHINIRELLNGVSPDYAIVAQKRAEPGIMAKFDKVFEQDYGLSLDELAARCDNRLINIEAKASEAEAKASEAEAKASEAEAKASEAEAKASEAEAKASEAEANIHALVNSKSWRITAPLRHVTRFFKYLITGITAWIFFRPGSRPRRVAKRLLRIITRPFPSLYDKFQSEKDRDMGWLGDCRVYGPGCPHEGPVIVADMYVLGQGVKTGIYRVCEEIYKRLSLDDDVNFNYYIDGPFREKSKEYLISKGYPSACRLANLEVVSERNKFFLSPFGVPPGVMLSGNSFRKIHIVYDLIAINYPDYFEKEGADEVFRIISSLDESTIIFAISESTKRDLLDYRKDLDTKQITVIPLAADERFYPCSNNDLIYRVLNKYNIGDGPYILSLATLEIRKNIEAVVHVFAEFVKNNPNSSMKLVLAGMKGWKLQKLEEQLEAYGYIKDRVVMPGFIDDEDLPALYSGAECFLYLSRYEGFGLPPLEAMACGVPVVTSNNSSLPEVVGDAGLMFDCDDHDGILQAVNRIVNDQELKEELRVKSLNQAKKFKWDHAVKIVKDRIRDEAAL